MILSATDLIVLTSIPAVFLVNEIPEILGHRDVCTAFFITL